MKVILMFFLFSIFFISCIEQENTDSIVNSENIIVDQIKNNLDSVEVNHTIKLIKTNPLIIEITNVSKPFLSTELVYDFFVSSLITLDSNFISFDSIKLQLVDFVDENLSFSISFSKNDYLKLKNLLLNNKDLNIRNNFLKYKKLIFYIVKRKYFLELLGLNELIKNGINEYSMKHLDTYDGNFLILAKLFLSECKNNEKYNTHMFSLASILFNARTSNLLKIINYCYYLCDLELITKNKLEGFTNGMLEYNVEYEWDDYDSTKLW